MGVARDVFVQGVHVLPGLVLALDLNPRRHVEEARARGVRVRHDDMALVDRLGQVFPGLGDRQLVLFALDRVEADRRDPGALPDPQRRGVGGVVIFLRQLIQALGRVALEVVVIGQQQQAGRRHAPDDVGLGVFFLGQQLGGDDARGIADPLDVDVRIVFFEGGFELLQLVRLDRRVDQKIGLRLGGRGPQDGGRGHRRQPQAEAAEPC